MRFIVDELPYYGDPCPLCSMCEDSLSDERCPRYWSKYKVCSDSNPHKCKFLIEAIIIDYSSSEAKTSLSDNDMTAEIRLYKN